MDQGEVDNLRERLQSVPDFTTERKHVAHLDAGAISPRLLCSSFLLTSLLVLLLPQSFLLRLSSLCLLSAILLNSLLSFHSLHDRRSLNLLLERVDVLDTLPEVRYEVMNMRYWSEEGSGVRIRTAWPS